MSTPTITRRTAWARLIVAMAEGLPDPQEIDFHTAGDMIFIKVDSVEALAEWAKYFDAALAPPHKSHEPGKWIHKANTSHNPGWYGYWVDVTAYVPGPAGARPVAENLSAVRALANETTRAGDPDLAPEVPAVATAQPGDSFTPAGEEVADPTGVSGSATAPEQVWMAVKRRGADFHKLDGDRTACGRSTVTGGTDGREFLTVRLGAKPCPRCYPGEAAK